MPWEEEEMRMQNGCFGVLLRLIPILMARCPLTTTIRTRQPRAVEIQQWGCLLMIACLRPPPLVGEGEEGEEQARAVGQWEEAVAAEAGDGARQGRASQKACGTSSSNQYPRGAAEGVVHSNSGETVWDIIEVEEARKATEMTMPVVAVVQVKQE
jgi:hypothetical protein